MLEIINAISWVTVTAIITLPIHNVKIVDFNEILCSKDALDHNFFMRLIASQKIVCFRRHTAAMGFS